MNGAKRWAKFMRFWNTIYAWDFWEAGDLVEYVNEEIEKIKKGDKLKKKPVKKPCKGK